MGVAGCEIPIGVGKARILLDRDQQLLNCFIEASNIEKRGAYGEKSPPDAGARAEPQRSSDAIVDHIF
jgi:hypothetical protein